MNKKNKRVRHLGRKVNNLVMLLMLVSMTLMVILCIYMFNHQTMRMLENRCVNGTNMLSYMLQHYDVDDADAINQILDDLKEEMRCEFTIFEGNTRAYTTVEQDGKRIIGTPLADDIAEIVLEQGKSYIGELNLFDTDYLCSYVPTKDEAGNINGLVFAGVSMEAASEEIDLTIKLSCAAGVTLVLISAFLMSLFIRSAVSKPLSKITTLAQTISNGDLGLERGENLTVDFHSNDEIGVLAEAFENTINYIGEISSILEEISKGNLTSTINQDYVGDFTSIKKSLEDILTKLNGTMSQIAESSSYVSNGSSQMSIGAQALSQGAVQQSSAVEELDGSMQNISHHVGETAENAQEASHKVELLRDQISESNQKMQEMIQAMQEISDSSNEISKIIKTIEDIALQTNILALNSAVEASRAGEAGKGFAVVAKEVRELAGKSSEASKSTTELIQRSITAVEYGSKIANQTASQLVSVVTNANEIAETTNQIANAAKIQANSVSQIQERIGQISNVVQTNSATAEESAATSEQLSEQANLLKSLIDVFHLSK